MTFEGKNLQKMGKWTENMRFRKHWDPRASFAPSLDNMHVYYHNIQRSSGYGPLHKDRFCESSTFNEG